MSDTSFQTLETEDVMKIFHASKRSVQLWAQSGKIPAIKTPGGKWVFLRTDIEKAFADRNKNKGGKVRKNACSEEYLMQSIRQATLEYLAAPDDATKWKFRRVMARIEEQAGRLFGFQFMDEVHAESVRFMQEKQQELKTSSTQANEASDTTGTTQQ